MDGDFIGSPQQFCVDMSHLDPKSAGSYSYDGTSSNSSPSPIMLFSSLDTMNYDTFPPYSAAYQGFESSPGSPVIEFTDLTAPYQEDRRRRRSHAIKDKQSISTMHMRRRAQNRASQRAFRERKEKHAQELQRQLDELEAKHQDLLASYHKLDNTNTKLTTQLEELRSKISTIQSSRSETLYEMMSSDIFEQYDVSNHGGNSTRLEES